MYTSYSDNSAALNLHLLDTACGLLGGMNAWLTRHSGDNCQIVNLIGHAFEIDSSLISLVVSAEQNSHQQPVLLQQWKGDTLMSASLSAHPETDACTYMLCVLFNNKFELNERLSGVVDALRCSMQAVISRHVYNQRLQSITSSGTPTASCECCGRIHNGANDMLLWNNLRPTEKRLNSSLCEQCVLAIYGDVMDNRLSQLVP